MASTQLPLIDITNEELITRFEKGDLPAGSFHHVHHVQLAFAYLSKFGQLEALEKFISALKRYAAARGKADLYHETITFAYFFLIRQRMSQNPTHTWEEFVTVNADLLRWQPGILERYYSEAMLRSDLARAVFLFPDKIAEL
jgi:hypothetical protein